LAGLSGCGGIIAQQARPASEEEIAMRQFCIELAVRDYECDLQGVVNNAVYQNYLEHARHEFLKSRGLDFARLTEQGVYVMLVRAELDYLRSLRSGDLFRISVKTERVSRLRMAFLQQVTLIDGEVPVLNARFVTAALNARGRPCFPAVLEALLATAAIERA
jgi:acyl-CoA thioester hydrolase